MDSSRIDRGKIYLGNGMHLGVIHMTGVNEGMEAIKKAIQMEKDGRAFYLNAAAQITSPLGEEVFQSLAADELVHLATFQKIFEKEVSKKEWDDLVNSSKKYANLTVFPKDLKSADGASADTNELDALNIAMDAEKKAIEFYGGILEETEDSLVRDILGEIIQQERNHYLILNEEFTYLSDTGHWYEMDYLGG